VGRHDAKHGGCDGTHRKGTGRYLVVEVKEIAVIDLRVGVDTGLHRHEERRCRPVHERVGLSLDVHFNESAGHVTWSSFPPPTRRPAAGAV
jgi:hypothetical protein